MNERYIPYEHTVRTASGKDIADFEVYVLVNYNEPRQANDLVVEIQSYWVKGMKWTPDGWKVSDKFEPLPESLVSELVQHEDSIQLYCEEDIIEDLELPFKPDNNYYGSAGRTL